MVKRITLFLVVSIWISSSYANPVPFRYPDLPAEKLSQEINKPSIKTAMILGGGPSGLISAIALKRTGYFDSIFVIEKRETYSRINTVSLRPESMTTFKNLGLLDKLQNKLIYSHDFHFFLKFPEENLLIQEIFSDYPSEVNYDLPINKAFERSGWPHFAINISDLEETFAEEINSLENVYLLHGTSEILNPSSAEKMSSVRFKSSSQKYEDFTVFKPELLVIAEGGSSPSREANGVSFLPAYDGRQPEHWCSGMISLDGILKTEEIKGHISIINKDATGQVVFGVFRPKEQDLFLNGKMTEEESKTWDAEKCLQENTYWLLKEEQEYLKVTLPDSPQSIQVRLGQSSKFDLIPKRADRFFINLNAVLSGDSAADGSPIGGLGISLVTSAYVDVLTKLVQNLKSQVMTRQLAFEAYAQRVAEIVYYRHFSLVR